MELKGSKTEECLKKALQGEALAHLKYQFYKSMLSKFTTEYDIILDEIIHNEKEHGKIWFKQLHNGGIPSNTINIMDAIDGEAYEFETMYPDFAEIAFEEGFEEIGNLFSSIASIEGNHMDTFQSILDAIELGDMFYNTDDEDTNWKCSNCGHILTSKNAPSECPVCKHPKKYFVEW